MKWKSIYPKLIVFQLYTDIYLYNIKYSTITYLRDILLKERCQVSVRNLCSKCLYYILYYSEICI